jgi:hypothetical protein
MIERLGVEEVGLEEEREDAHAPCRGPAHSELIA